MLTDAKLAANQRNAQLSTGPVTPEGKAASSNNRVTHGLFSWRDLVRPEEQSEYDALRASLDAELCPATAMERTHAHEILHAAWRLQRCALVESRLLDSALESGLDPMEDTAAPSPHPAARTQSNVDRARAHARNNLRRASEDLSRLQTERRLRAELDSTPAPDGLVSRQNLTKTLAQEARRQLISRKLTGTDTFESLLRRAVGEPAREDILRPITIRTHRPGANPPPSAWDDPAPRHPETDEPDTQAAEEIDPNRTGMFRSFTDDLDDRRSR